MDQIIETLGKEASLAITLAKPASDSDREGVALCLSGGGYRAALFHLGVMRCLHDMGILQSIRTVSSVSGGSIIAAYIAKRMFEENVSNGVAFDNWETQISEGFRSFVLTDIRTLPIVLHSAWNWLIPKWRAAHLERNYARKLLTVQKAGQSQEMTLKDLPETPNFIFCSTDLTFGVNWIFTRKRVGDYKVGYEDGKAWNLATAVAASSCFPPFFGPLMLNLDPKSFLDYGHQEPDRSTLLSNIRLTDGGVYDNFGLEPVDLGYQTMIVSDGGAPFEYSGTGGPFSRLWRIFSVVMDQVAALRKRMFFTGITGKLYTGAYVEIGRRRKSPRVDQTFDGYLDGSVRSMIANIRTDLDRFDDAEARILENHGYFETHRRVLKHLPDLIRNLEYTPVTPHPEWEDESKIASALRTSASRFSFSRLLRSIW